MASSVSDVREIVERVCSRPDVLEACGHRDLGVVIEILGAHGVTQGQIAGLTGISQGRLSEYRNHKRKPTASSIFEAFADGLGMPPTARRVLGLSPDPAVTSVAALPGLPSADVGLVYPATPVETSENLARLWRADVVGASLLRARLDPVAWNDASLRWLIDRGRQQDSEIARGARIGMADVDRSARTRPARQAFLKRFETEVDPNGELQPDERHRRAEHALRAYMLRLAQRAVAARKSR